MDKFKISRQAANSHLRRLVAEGALEEHGETRARSYKLAPIAEWRKVYPINEQTAEDIVWRQDISVELGKLPENVRQIWYYGLTEMFNNARDHSGGSHVVVEIEKTAVSTRMLILDNGVGIFRKIQQQLGLLDERQAIFELSKGKLTTDPKNHTGQGIFFTSRMFDEFDILSGGVYFSHEFGKTDAWFAEREQPKDGTAIFLNLNNHTARTTQKIYDQYTGDGGPDDFAFSKTVVPVKLAQYGNDELISRSQGKRVMARVDLFKKVILDFEGVPAIGQPFADQVFRVFQLEHPQVTILPINANSEVRRMIVRALNDAASPSASPSMPFTPSEEGGDGSSGAA